MGYSFVGQCSGVTDMTRIEIQMYQADEFIVETENVNWFKMQLQNVDYGYCNLVNIKDIKGKWISFNPRYVAYIKYEECEE